MATSQDGAAVESQAPTLFDLPKLRDIPVGAVSAPVYLPDSPEPDEDDRVAKLTIRKAKPTSVPVEPVKAAPPAAAPAAEKAPSGEPPRRSKSRGTREVTAEMLAGQQRDISVSEFFAKNRHLLGFDNKRKALLTTVKEAVDNSLDACEEAHLLPEIHIVIDQLAEDRFRATVRDNGPGIVRGQIPNIFGKLLYGSKFHRLKMARGQQGIGISAAGMYGLLTTGKSVRITSRTSPKKESHYFEIQMDTAKNKADVIMEETTDVPWERGTGAELETLSLVSGAAHEIDREFAEWRGPPAATTAAQTASGSEDFHRRRPT